MRKIAMLFVVVMMMGFVVSGVQAANCITSLSSPTATIRGPFNVVASGSCGENATSSVSVLIDGSGSFKQWCYSATNCILDLAVMNHGVLAEVLHGEHTAQPVACGYDGTCTYGPITTFFADNKPDLSATLPSGTVRGHASVSGTANFAPTKNSKKGDVYVYLDNGSSPTKSLACYQENCPFPYSDILSTHGEHTITVKAVASGTEDTVTGSFFSDRTPHISQIGPCGSVINTAITGHVSFAPAAQAWTGLTGKIDFAVDGRAYTGSVNCYSFECDINIPLSNLSAGDHTIQLTATPWWNGPYVSSSVQTFKVREYLKSDFPPDCKANACGESTFNVISGSVNHDQELFEAAGGPLPTKFSIYYESKDQFDIAPTKGSPEIAKFPLGQGWTHSYDITLYTNPGSKAKILRGGGLSKRFYAPSGTTFVSQPGDTSILVKNSDSSYSITHRDGLKYNFTSNGYLTSIVDRYSNAVALDRSVAGKLKITDPAGRVTVLGYDSYGERITTVTDPEGAIFNLEYNSLGLLSKVMYPAPAAGEERPTWSYTYNNSRLLQTKTDPEEQTVTYSYGDDRKVTLAVDPEGIINPSGHSKSLFFDPATSTTSVTEKDGHAWQYTVDSANGLVMGKTDPDGNSIRYTYDSADRVLTQTTPVDTGISYIKKFQYDAGGNITDVQGHARRDGSPPVDEPVDLHLGFTYDLANFDRITSYTDYLANQTVTMTYDQDGSYHRTRTTGPFGTVTTRQHANGNIHDVAYPDGASRTYGYTSSGILQSVTDNHNIKTEFSDFTARGLPQTVKIFDSTGAVKYTSTYTYDALGRLKSKAVIGTSDNYVTTYGYDRMGNVAQTTDANGNPTTVAFNYKGLPRQITDALGEVTGLEYVSAENLSALTDANDNRTEFSYTPRGLLAKETPPVGAPIRYGYNPAGKVTKKINDTTNEVLIAYSYDPQGRLTGRSFLDGTSDSFTYDAASRLSTAGNQNISYTFVYDGYGRLQSQTDNSGNVVAYGYDVAGRRTSLTVNNSHTVTYGYTADKLASITSSLAGAFGYGYDSLGRRGSITYPNGISGTYTYNADQPGWLAGISYVGTGDTIYSVSYPTFDKVGNRMAKNERSLTTYGYDAVYRLLNSAAGEVFTYDGTGNRLSDAAKLYTITAGNVMAAAGATSYTYDSYGNTLTAGQWTYGWNSAGQMASAINGNTVVGYAYDPFGRRISKTVNGAVISYVYDGQDIAAMVSEGNTTHFVHGPGVDEHLALVQGAPYFYHVDGLGSITKITDSGQNVVQAYSYTSFGTPTPSTGFQQPFGFTGREYDPETGHHYYRSRTYNTDTGRFLRRDSLGFAGGDVVLTNYVGGNPVNFVDPNGTSKVDVILKIGRSAWNHVIKRHISRNEFPGKSKFLDPTQVRKNAQKTVKRPDKITCQANGRTLYEKNFEKQIGTQGETIQRVVVESDGNLVTTFPSKSFNGTIITSIISSIFDPFDMISGELADDGSDMY